MLGSNVQKDVYGLILCIGNFINHILIILITAYILYLTGSTFTVLNVHVGLCTVGYVLLMSEAFMVLGEENLWSHKMSRNGTNHIHWVLQVCGVAFNIAGILVMYRINEVHGKSMHAILGFTSIISSCFISFSGIAVIFAMKLHKIIRPVWSKLVHNFLGIISFIFGILSQCYGYNKEWMINNAGKEIATLCIVFTGFIAILSILRPVRSLWGQIKAICS